MRLSVLAVLIGGCSGGSQSASGTLDPSKGGTVGISDGSAAVAVGPNALAAATQVTVGADPTLPPASLGVPVSGCFRFGPEGLQFQSPVTVTLAIDAARLPSGSTENEVFIATAQAGSSSFTGLATTIADAAHVSAQTAHFSVFCALSPPVSDAAVAMDLGERDLPAVLQTDGPAPLPDLLLPSTSPSPSCSPYPAPSPSAGCMALPAPSAPPAGCGWELQCSSSVPYSVFCTGNLCSCYQGGTQTQNFLQGSACTTVDGGTNSNLWQKCCFPQ